MAEAPHVLLITTDQQRGDCLGIEGHPVLQTPNLDHLARSGTWFRRGYSECPVCIPARRTLMSGVAPAAHGMVGYAGGVTWNPPHTLAGEFHRAGYQTEMIGKLHLHPPRRRYGFNHVQLGNSVHAMADSDYIRWLVETHGRHEMKPGMAHGLDGNGWVGRPHILPEEQMLTFWCIDRALRFLERRDPSAPFFLNVSLADPHPPLAPPAFYYDRYVRRDLPPPVVGDWADDPFGGPTRGLATDAPRIHLDEQQMQCARAAYYGMINFIDDQIGRLLLAISRQGLMQNTIVLFSSDHGEMLGDHHRFCKSLPYEASARVPFLMRLPTKWGVPGGRVCRTRRWVGRTSCRRCSMPRDSMFRPSAPGTA
ncbi:MAG: sulfatase-like hydrolase/transferase [Phycisphaeraceae bacterium]